MMRQGRDLEMLQNTIQKSQRERENMQSEMDVLLDRINKMSDMLDKSRVGQHTSQSPQIAIVWKAHPEGFNNCFLCQVQIICLNCTSFKQFTAFSVLNVNFYSFQGQLLHIFFLFSMFPVVRIMPESDNELSLSVWQHPK